MISEPYTRGGTDDWENGQNQGGKREIMAGKKGGVIGRGKGD